MAKNKRKVFFSRFRVCVMLKNEYETRYGILKPEVFDVIMNNYHQAENTGNFSLFQMKNEDSKQIYVLNKLHYENDILCGIIGRGMQKIERFLREYNPNTFDEKELTPSKGNIFQEYSYFAVSLKKMQIAYLDNSAVSSNIPRIIVLILRQALGSAIYDLEEEKLIDYDIKSKIKSLGNKVSVKGTLIGQEQSIIGGKKSLSDLEKALGSKFKATVRLSAKVSKKFIDDDIDQIANLATQDEGFSTFSFTNEEEGTDKEIIDVIRKQVYYSKDIDLNEQERLNPEIIWHRMCNALH